jgi:hypothetical protein
MDGVHYGRRNADDADLADGLHTERMARLAGLDEARDQLGHLRRGEDVVVAKIARQGLPIRLEGYLLADGIAQRLGHRALHLP